MGREREVGGGGGGVRDRRMHLGMHGKLIYRGLTRCRLLPDSVVLTLPSCPSHLSNKKGKREREREREERERRQRDRERDRERERRQRERDRESERDRERDREI